MVELDGTLLIQFLNFFILVAILAKFAYKPMHQVLEARRERIAKDIAAADEAKAMAEKVKAEYEAHLRDARLEAQAIIDKANKQAQANTEAELQELRAQIAREKENARQEIEREHEKAMSKLREEVVELSIAVASKVLAKEVSAKDNEAMIQSAIDKLDSKALRL